MEREKIVHVSPIEFRPDLENTAKVEYKTREEIEEMFKAEKLVVPPSFYEKLKREGCNMKNYVKSKLKDNK